MAGAVQSFIDSDAGLVVATTLHTAGAILFLGGLTGYLVWHRHLAHGQHQVKALAGAAALTYLAIAANLVGGFMRTYAEGHPGLSHLGDSPWVRVMLVKHLFLFAGMAAAVWLFEVAAPRLVRAHRDGTLREASPPGHRFASRLVAASILAAALLGALSQVTPLAEGQAPMEGGHPAHAHAVTYENATGQLTSTPLAPATATDTFRVPANTSRLEATLTWSPTQFELTLAVANGEGEGASAGPVAPGRAELSVEAPRPGPWTATLTSGLAVDTEWRLSVRLVPAAEGETVLAGTRTIPAGSFFEINTEMPAGASLRWDWRATGGPLHFDVHSHFGGEVQTWAEADGGSDAGAFTNGRAGGYSYLWQNEGAAPVRLAYRAWGGFTLDSYAP